MASPFYGLKPVSVFNFVEGFAVLLRRKILRLYFAVKDFYPFLLSAFLPIDSINFAKLIQKIHLYHIRLVPFTIIVPF